MDATLLRSVHAAIARVADPELSLSIVDVGLVYGVTLADRRVEVLLTMTSPACPVGEMIIADLHAELEAVLPADFVIACELCWEPPWDPAMLSARARSYLDA